MSVRRVGGPGSSLVRSARQGARRRRCRRGLWPPVRPRCRGHRPERPRPLRRETVWRWLHPVRGPRRQLMRCARPAAARFGFLWAAGRLRCPVRHRWRARRFGPWCVDHVTCGTPWEWLSLHLSQPERYCNKPGLTDQRFTPEHCQRVGRSTGCRKPGRLDHRQVRCWRYPREPFHARA